MESRRVNIILLHDLINLLTFYLILDLSKDGIQSKNPIEGRHQIRKPKKLYGQL